MRKLKKILAVALAAALVLSCAPFAGAVSELIHSETGAPYTEGDGYEYGTDEFENPVSNIWVDTSGTTEVWRLNAGEGSLLFGDYLTLASATGIPKSCAVGNKMYYATAGECNDTSIEPLLISYKVYGATGTISDVSLSQTAFTSGWTAQGYNRTGSDSNGSYTEYYWDVTPNNTYCASPNSTIQFVMTFKYNGATYSATAFAKTEYVYNPAGSLAMNHANDDNTPLVSALMLLYAKQARPEINTTQTSTEAHYGRINFLKLAKSDGGTTAYLTGCHTADEWDALANDSFGRRTAQSNGDYGFVRKSYKNNNGGTGSVYLPFTDATTTCGITVWMDKYTDHLGTGTSGSKENGLNLRYTIHNTDMENNHWNAVVAVGFSTSASDSTAISSDTTSNSTFGVSYNTSSPGLMTGYSNLSYMMSNYPGEDTEGQIYGIQGATTYLKDEDIDDNDYILFRLQGDGPSSSGQSPTSSPFFLQVRARGERGQEDMSSQNYSNGVVKDGTNVKAGMVDVQTRSFVRFRVYSTEKLRTLINAIDRGTTLNSLTYGGEYGSSVSSNTKNITSAAKGMKFPQSWMFTASTWSTFVSAYNTAKGYLADFTAGAGSSWTYTGPNSKTIGLEQNNINNAITALINAYNGLALAPNPKIKVHHVATLYDSNHVKAADDVVYTGWLDADHTTLTDDANPAYPFKNGVKVTLRALTTLSGYVVDGVSSISNATMSNVNGTTTLYDSTNAAIGTAGAYAEYTFYYKPADNTLQILPFKPNASLFLDQQVKTGQTPYNFASKLNTNIGGYPGFNFEGLYTEGDTVNYQVSGTKIDPATWAMPEQDTRLYINWVPKPVDLHVVTSYGDEEIVGAPETPTVTSFNTETKVSELSSVQFSKPAAPTAQNMSFVNFYKDAEFTQVIQDSDWPITASYDAEATYPITEVTSASVMTPVNNKVTIYALYADLSNKIYFDAQGGTMPAGYESNVMTFTSGTQFTYPVPTREGYVFTGWVTADGDPVNSDLPEVNAGQWTFVDPTTKTGFGAYPNGNITINGTTGFVCYATWAPNTITLTYRLSIPSSETSTYNSPDSAARPYFVINVDADSPITADMMPNKPRRFGWKFDYWILNNRRMNIGDRTPTESTTIYASWAPAFNVAFADLTSYIRYNGEDQIADLQHGTPEIEAAPGDIVNIRFRVSGKFYAGASSFIFGYNQSFYDQIAGVDVLKINEDNAYISAIHAVPDRDITVIQNYTANTIDDYTYDGETANTKVVMVTIDPNVVDMGTYNTVDFQDDEYLLEIKLKIKDTAQAGSLGSVWLALDQLRTSDNIMGDLFISYSADPADLTEVQTAAISFDTETVATTVRLADEERPDTTVYLKLLEDDFGHKGSWAGSGNADDITLHGPEGTEVLTLAVGGVTYTGFPTPEKTGYTLEGFFKYDTATGTFDMTDELGAGCYGTEAQDGNTYAAVWTAETRTIRFFNADSTLNATRTVTYDQVGGITAPMIGASGVYTLYGWVPYDPDTNTYNKIDENLVLSSYFSSDYHVTDDACFIAWTKLAQKTPYVVAYKDTVTDPDTGTVTYTTVGSSESNSRIQLTAEAQTALGIEIRYGDTLIITESATAASMVPNGNTAYGNETNTVTISLQQIDMMLRRAELSSNGAVDLDSTDNEYAEYSSYTFAYIPTSGGLSSTNARNYEVVATYLDSTLAAAPSYTFALANANSPSVYVAYQGATVTETFNATYQNVSGTWATDNWPANMTVSGTTLSVVGRYDETYDVDFITSQLTPAFGYTFSSWNTTANLGTHRGNTKTVRWNAATVTGHFYNEAGTTEASTATAAYNANMTLPSTAPEKTGYSFAGWIPAELNNGVYTAIAGRTATTGNYDLDAAANDPENTIVATTTSTTDPDTGVTTTTTAYDIYFVPTYEINNYNVIYKVDGTVDTSLSDNADYNATYTVAAEPTRTGYTFDGWYDETAPTVKVNALSTQTMGGADVTYNGTFNANAYKVEFNANGGQYQNNETGLVDVNYDAAIAAPAYEPVKTGFSFAGWATTNNAQTADFASTTLNATNFPSADFSTAGTTVATYYAVWDVAYADYSVEFYYENADDAGYTKDTAKTVTGLQGQISSTVSVDQATIDANVETGFAYNSGASTVSGTVAQDGSLVLSVYYNRLTYVLTKDIDGVTSSAGTFKYGADLTGVGATLETPTKDHYVFDYWTLSDNTMPIGGATITAHFTEEQYTIAYNLNGGTGTQPAGGTVTYGQSYSLAAVSFSKTGYTFKGWYLGTDGSNLTTKLGDAGETITIGDLGANGDTITVYANWEINHYTFTYKLDADNEYTTQPYDHGDTVTAPTDPQKAGYTFAGWSPALPATATGDRTFTATWTPINYTITFYKENGQNGETAFTTITQGYETPVSAPASDPTKEGHTFAGWYTGAGETGSLVEWPVTMPLGGTTYYAHWTVNPYTITFNSDGGSAVASITQNYDTQVLKPADPTKDGYTFAGWFNGSDEVTWPVTMPEGGLNLTAHWNANTYKIVLKYGTVNGNAVYQTIEQAYGTPISAVTPPTFAGYDFDGWSESIPETMPVTAENGLVITAQWVKHQYTLVYNLAGGTNVDITINSTVSYDDTITLPVWNTNFTRDGYSFANWSDGTSTYASGASYTVPAQPSNGDTITITASYNVNSYTFYYMDGSTTIDSIANINYGTSIANYNGFDPTASYSKPGYTFAGWYEDQALSTPFAYDTMPSHDVYVYAKYNEIEYSVVFVSPDDVSGEGLITFNNNQSYFTVIGVTVNNTIAAQDTSNDLAGNYDVENFTLTGWTLDPNAAEPVIYTLAQIGQWSAQQFASDLGNDTTLKVYPVYERVEVTLDIVSDNVEVDVEEGPPAVGYIYNAGDRRTKAQIETELGVIGNGTLVVHPTLITKKGEYCGTGTKVEVIDDITNQPVEVYYLVVFGDVNGDANCSSLDYTVMKGQAELTADKQTWELTEDTTLTVSDLTADQQILCKCYTRAADVDETDGFGDGDVQMVYLYILKIYPYDFNKNDKKYFIDVNNA